MKPSVLVLTCDRYEPYWRGFWHFMEKHWDFDIDVPIYFCNEEKTCPVPDWCRQILTGRGTFVENLKKALEMVESEDIFLMLEDFWPIAPLGRKMFDGLYGFFGESGWDALQLSNYTPYYKVRRTGMEAAGLPVLEFEPDSEWIFNFQARFWKSKALYDCLVEPEVSEREAGSAITVEIASDRAARESGKIRAGLCHYLWYPISGVSYRGNMTEFGHHLQNIVEIDKFVEGMFSPQCASSIHQVCSG